MLNGLRILQSADKRDYCVEEDFLNFAFVRSVRTLKAVRRLNITVQATRNNPSKEFIETVQNRFGDDYFYEDSILLCRSIYENYIMGYYAWKNFDDIIATGQDIRDLIVNPIGLGLEELTLDNIRIPTTDGKTNKKRVVKDASGRQVGDSKTGFRKYVDANPDAKLYHSLLYPFLCRYAHCDFSAVDRYLTDMNREQIIKTPKTIFKYWVPLLTLFVFEKIFETNVTVKGEEFRNLHEEKVFYSFAFDMLDLLSKSFRTYLDVFINEKWPVDGTEVAVQYYFRDGNRTFMKNKPIVMLMLMKDSLKIELGSLKKNFNEETGRFDRIMPEKSK